MDQFGNIYILIADDEIGKNEFDDKISSMKKTLQIEHPEWKFIPVNKPNDTIKVATNRNEFISFVNELKNSRDLNEDIKKDLEKIDENTKLDLILLDIEFPNKENGLKVAQEICEQKINLPIIFFSQHEDPETIIGALTGETADAIKSYPFKDYCTKKMVLLECKYDKLDSKIVNLLKSSGRFKNNYGILITHGTDTMAWGFAILRYALKNIKCNIVLTGSQLPLQGFYSPSDAIGNLRTALMILCRFPPPGIYVAFDNGKKIFSSHLQKVRKWDFDAFCGKILGRVIWDDIKTYCEGGKTVPLSAHPEPHLERLYLLRTGGTIESEKDPATGALKPTGDFVSAYLNTTLAKDFVRGDILNCYPSLKKDSSYLSIEHWKQVSEWICEIEEGESSSKSMKKKDNAGNEKKDRCDWKFDTTVKPVLTNPFFTTKDYEALFENARRGIILLGYGAGNANVDPNEHHNWLILPALQEAIKQQKIVVVSSQVPMEIYDFEYEAGRLLLENGAIPSGSLSYPECQVKLAYILGHEDKIKTTAEKYKLSETQLIKAAFLAGVTFQKEESKKEYERITKSKDGGPPVIILPYDPFVDPEKNFDKAIEEVAMRQPR